MTEVDLSRLDWETSWDYQARDLDLVDAIPSSISYCIQPGLGWLELSGRLGTFPVSAQKRVGFAQLRAPLETPLELGLVQWELQWVSFLAADVGFHLIFIPQGESLFHSPYWQSPLVGGGKKGEIMKSNFDPQGWKPYFRGQEQEKLSLGTTIGGVGFSWVRSHQKSDLAMSPVALPFNLSLRSLKSTRIKG